MLGKMRFLKMKVAELRKLVKEKNLNTSGLHKAKFIAWLREAEKAENEEVAEIESEDEQDDGQVNPDGDAAGGGGKETEAILALRLPLELEKMRAKRVETEAKMAETERNIEKERLRCSRILATEILLDSTAAPEKEVRHLLPRMSDNSDDCLSFFHSLEITLTLNNVPKLLPLLLSARAQKCYSHISRLKNAWISKR